MYTFLSPKSEFLCRKLTLLGRRLIAAIKILGIKKQANFLFVEDHHHVTSQRLRVVGTMLSLDMFLNDESNSFYKRTSLFPFETQLTHTPLSIVLLLFLASLGSITFIYYSLSLLSLLYHILTPGIPLSTFRKSSPHPWALITGPTSGIGKSYAHALAKAKFNLILVSRSQTKLDSLAQEIKATCPDCEIRVVAVDLSGEVGGEVRGVCGEVTRAGGDVRILVNNAGRGHEMPTEFKDVEREEMEEIVGVNVCGVLRVTKDVLPFMLNDKSSPHPQ